MLSSWRGGHGRNRVHFDIRIGLGGGSGSRRGSVGGIQSHARGGGSGPGAFCSAVRDMKGRGRGGGRRLVMDASAAVVSRAAGGAGAEK